MSAAAELNEEADYPEVCSVSRVLGTGYNLPDHVVTNDYFASYLDTSAQWIRDRTGISERRWVEGDVPASELAEPAARDAISRAGLQSEDIARRHRRYYFRYCDPGLYLPKLCCFSSSKAWLSRWTRFRCERGVLRVSLCDCNR